MHVGELLPCNPHGSGFGEYSSFNKENGVENHECDDLDWGLLLFPLFVLLKMNGKSVAWPNTLKTNHTNAHILNLHGIVGSFNPHTNHENLHPQQ